MSADMLYLDTSFVAPLVLNEEVSPLVESYLAKQAAGSLAISHWTRVEFACLVAQGVKTQHFSTQTASTVLAEFEALIQGPARSGSPAQPTTTWRGLCWGTSSLASETGGLSILRLPRIRVRTKS